MDELCPRLRILFVSFFESDFYINVCNSFLGIRQKDTHKKGSRDGFPFYIYSIYNFRTNRVSKLP